ncbi:MAG: carboxypeptidase regulatory-like domain-containing protein [Armatimonadetes bacterium]|nr:carboxypeptidase regulatory-like domain-containing protein [Armatimonadota bacterium]
MRTTIGFLGLTLLLGGCFSAIPPGEISGTVTDITGDPVRGADIYLDGVLVTQSSPVGTFTIRKARPGLREVKAVLEIEGAFFRGRNRAIVYEFERTTSISIVVARLDQLGHVRGWVEDEFGRRLVGVRVFAGGPLNSWMDITDSDGEYDLKDLVSGYTYTMTASGRGYENDSTAFDAVAGKTGVVNFRLRASTNQPQGPPGNLTAIAWTSPVEPNRSREQAMAYERIKRIFDENRARRPASSRGGPGLVHLEIDLEWDFVFYEELLGYGIYRGTSPANLQPLDVLRDPLASFYSDISDELLPNVRYYYEVTLLNTSFPEVGGSESLPSLIASAVPLDDLTLFDPSLFPLTFFWMPVLNTDEYLVFLFSYYPDFQAVPIWTSPTTPGTSIPYTGPSLVPGERYYYVVLGLGFGGDSRTISKIDNFIAP